MITIKPIQPHQYEAARGVMEEVTVELWGMTLEDLRPLDPLSDFQDFESAYVDRGGTFLVILDGERVVGTGGIVPTDDETCVLRRVWLLRPYRGRGLGKQLTQQLLLLYDGAI